MVFEQEHSNQNEYYIGFITEDVSCEEHFHTAFELMYVIEGAVDETLDGKTFTVHKGDFILTMPGQNHHYYAPEGTRYFVCLFSPDLVDSFWERVRDKMAINPVFQIGDMSILHELLLYKRNDVLMLRSYLFYICSQFLKKTALVHREQNGQSLTNLLTEYVQENYEKNLTLGSIAQELGYNYSYLSRYFSRNFHVNFRSFLNEFRICEAMKRLSSSRESITIIAMECGFDSIRSFNRAFMQMKKMTPSQYRKMA